MNNEDNGLPTVLIIEDNLLVKETLRMLLEDVSVVETAANVEDAKELIDDNPGALLIAVDGRLDAGGQGTEVVAYSKKKGFAVRLWRFRPIVTPNSSTLVQLTKFRNPYASTS
jgi:response regulator RpfG family c-di-GMP phosphodiesterase